MLALGTDNLRIEQGDADTVPVEREPQLASIITATRRLNRAERAELVRLHRASGLLTVLAQEHKPGAGIPAASPGFSWPGAIALSRVRPGSPEWFDAHDSDGAALAVWLTERGQSAYLLILRFDSISVLDRARISASAGDIATMLAAVLDLENQLWDAREREAAVALALDHTECGVIAVRADQSVAFMNQAGSALVAQGCWLRLRRGAIYPTNYQDAIRFQTALHTVCDPAGSAPGKPPRAFVMLSRADHDQPIVIVIAPATASTLAGPGSGADDGAVAIIYTLNVGHRRSQGLEAICQLYGLSRVETRLVLHLYAGLTISETAAEMRVKLETARAYLKQVFAKTGTHRQTELVSLLLRCAAALRGEFDFQAA